MGKPKRKVRESGPVLVIGDLHEPFTHPGYLPFCSETYRKFRCVEVVFIGDIVDNHAVSFHDHDPSGMSPGSELDRAKAKLKHWTHAFPRAKVCIGNHDARMHIRARKFGLPDNILRSLGEIYHTPGWDYQLRHEIGEVLYMHGTKYSGMTAHRRIAMENRQSTAIGHIHSHAGVCYLACHKDLIFGMNVGCGVDIHTYAMEYGTDFQIKPVLGCGVVFGKRQAQFIPMDLGDRR